MSDKPTDGQSAIYLPPSFRKPGEVSSMSTTWGSLQRIAIRFCTWLGTSKPTEWLVVIGAIVGYYLYVQTGLFTAKQDMLNATNERLKAEGIRSEARNDWLKEQQVKLEERNAQIAKDTDLREKALVAANAAVEKAKREAEVYKSDLVRLAEFMQNIKDYEKYMVDYKPGSLSSKRYVQLSIFNSYKRIIEPEIIEIVDRYKLIESL